jgi:hypothetical protein
MDRLYKRPMFRRGGSANSNGTGITSGLAPRQGYDNGGSSRQRIMNAMGANPPKRNFNDFLINFGLDLASRPSAGPGFGGLITTAAQSAKDPYEKFSKARDADSNLMRQVGMESEIMDINKENAAAAAAAKDASAMSRLQAQIQADKDLYNLEKGENLNALITARAQESIADGKFNNYNAATNEAEWTFRGSKEYKDKIIGGVLSEKQSNDAKSQAKFAKSQGKKNGVGKIYYDPYKDQVLEVAVVEGDYVLRPVGGVEEVVDTTAVVEDKDKSFYEQMTGKENKPYTYKDYVTDTNETTKKIKDVITTPVDMSTIDTTNIRRR